MKLLGRHKTQVLLLLGVVCASLFVPRYEAHLKNIPNQARNRTEAAHLFATTVLKGEKHKLNPGFPEPGEKIIGCSSFSSDYGYNQGGGADIHLIETDAARPAYDPERDNWIERPAGCVKVVVGLRRDPMIETYYSNSPSARAFAERLVARMRAEDAPSRVDSPVEGLKNATLGVDLGYSPFETLVMRGAKYSPLVVIASILGILVLLVRVWIERRRLAAGIYCDHCGYDLRGAVENRCSECGAKFDLTRG